MSSAKNPSRYYRYFANRKLTLQQREQERQTVLRRAPEFFKVQLQNNVDETVQFKDREWKYMPGDRVQVLSGEDKGKVGKIASLAKDSNAVYVEGLGGTTRVVVPPHAFFPGQTRPVVDAPNMIKAENIRLVASIREENGAEKDVAVHSVSLSGEYYDADYNKYLPYRRLTHDPEVIIPWPRPENPLAKSEFATPADVVEERTFFPNSILEPPLPEAALSQVRNKYSRFKRRAPITAKDVREMTAPEMPLTATKKAYLAELKAKRSAPRPQLNTEITDFIGDEIAKGLQKRLIEEEQHYQQYQ